VNKLKSQCASGSFKSIT